MSFDPLDAMPFMRGTLYGALRQKCSDVWGGFVEHRFLRELAAGTLGREEFLAWMVQDYLYLVHYTRAYALLIYKSGTLAEMRDAAIIVHGLLTGEMALHRRMLQAEGVSPGRLDTARESIETLAYGRYILDRGIAGDSLDLAVTLSACLAGYGEIGLTLKADPRTKLQGNPYRDWIDTYSGADYMALVRDGVARLQMLADTHGGEARFPLLLVQFRQAVRLETAFWDAGRTSLADAL